MKYVDKCVICNSRNLSAYNAATAPFIASRVWDSKPFKVKLFHCRNCDFVFFNLRMQENEMAALYKDYRDETYQHQRNSFEKWYTKEINEKIGNNPTEIRNRNKNLSDILLKTTDVTKIKTVLDFGGDKGQFIPEVLRSAEKYVYDISGITPNQGVKSIQDLSESRSLKFDLIMCCHVLEHVPYPPEILEQIKRFSRKDSIYYFEVPFDSPFQFQNILSFKNIIKHFLYSVLPIYKCIRFIFSRSFEMHEHVNFFSVNSLKNLMDVSGLKVQYISVRPIDSGWIKNNVLCCIAKNQ